MRTILKFILVVGFASVSSLFFAQAAGATEYACTFTPAKKPARGVSLIPEFLLIEIDAQNPDKIKVTDAFSLHYNGAASDGAVLRNNGQKIRFAWSLRVKSTSGRMVQIQYNLRLNSTTGKATLSATGEEILQGLFGRGGCLIK